MQIIGVDEAGRGAWAGPLVAAAVALNEPLEDMNDSKLLTPRRRDILFGLIMDSAKVGVGLVLPQDIDRYGLSRAQEDAMLQAVKALGVSGGQIIVDGSIDYLKLPNSRALIKADSSVPAVMAASVIAKVTRDRMMVELEDEHPGYGFAAHKGYGTLSHRQALKALGISNLHRKSYKPIARLLI